MDPKLLQQIEQYLKDSGLNAQDLKNRMDAVKASTVEFNRELINARRHFAEMNTTFSDLSQQFKNVVDDLTKIDSTSNKINKSFKTLGGFADKLKYDAENISILNKKDLQNIEKKALIELSNLKARKAELDISVKQRFQNLSNEQIASIGARTRDKNLAKQISQYLELSETLDDQGNLINDENNAIKTLLTLTQKRLKEEEDINRTLGISGKIVEGIIGSLNKLGVSSDFFENLKEDMRDAAKSGDKWKVVSTATSGIIKGIGDALKDPVTQLTILLKIANFFIKAALTANSEVVKLGKSLGSSSEEYRENLVKAERSSNSINVTTKNLVAAFDELVTATGYVGEFSADTLKTQIMLTKEFGLTGDEAAGVYKFSALTGKASSTINKEMVGAFAATRNSLKAGIPFKAAIAEAAKVSGALSSNFQNDPKRIAAAVVQAKALGTSLEQTAKQGEALLNFESSIENELKAELLTGRQLNLERARAAALAGDQVTLTEELVKNVGSIEEFDRMNVLQKKALAEAVGLSTDELAKQLQNQKIAQETGKSIAQVTQDQLLEEQKRQDVQSKFNAAIEKLQSLIGNLVAGPLGSFFNLLSGALNIVNEIGKALSFLAIPLKIIGGLFLAIKTSQLAIHGYQLAINSSKAVEQGLLARQMILEEGKFNLSRLNHLLQGESYRVKLAAYAVSLREIIAERAKNIATSIGNLLGKKGLLSSIGSAVMGAISAIFKGPTAFLGPFAIPIALAAGATVGAIGAKFLFAKGGIVTGEINNATVGEAGPEAIIPLNSPKADKILGNNEIPSIDLTPMISAINEVRAAVNNLMNRPVVVNMDGKQIGSSLVQSSYKMA